jgi:hypothetical protein
MIGLLVSAPVGAQAAVFMTTFQGATFTVTQNSATDFTFDIAGANALTGDWAGAKYLGDFAFNNIGAAGATLTATLINPATGQPATSPGSGGLNANGCSGSGNFFCFDFSPNVAVASDLKFDIAASGGTFNFASTGPDLKILWSNDAAGDTHVGSLFSASIPVTTGGGVPEPYTWSLMLVGVGAIGAAMRIHRKTAATA